MRGDAQTVKERLSIVDVLSPYLKLEKSGLNYKARCPFHNEKTASFYVSPTRQTYYCFGCGMKGDIFTFVEEMEGTDFRGALKILAEKAGVEIEYKDKESRGEKERIYEVLERATEFFVDGLNENAEAKAYLISRGLNEESIKEWGLGFAKEEWRELYAHLLGLGFNKGEMLKAGLIKTGDESKEPYDTFRGRIIFPLFDTQGRVIAFSGRALGTVEPKYLNSPDGILFNKSEVLYGLDKAKDSIRKKNYSILVEGQMDLVLSHQAGVKNTVASSGTAFTQMHLERLKRLSDRVILAFDGDEAGEKAAYKSALLGLSLGMEIKIAAIPLRSDPADLAQGDGEKWKEALVHSTHAIEFFLGKLLEKEKDPRKSGKLILNNVLPLLTLLGSSIERAHFISLIAKRSGIKEDLLWEDMRKTPTPQIANTSSAPTREEVKEIEPRIELKERITTRLAEVNLWLSDMEAGAEEYAAVVSEKSELEENLAYEILRERLGEKIRELALAEGRKDEQEVSRLSTEIRDINREMKELEEKKKKV